MCVCVCELSETYVYLQAFCIFCWTKIIHYAGEGTVYVATTWLLDEDTQSFGAREGSHRGFPQAYL